MKVGSVWDRSGRLFPMLRFEIERLGGDSVPVAALIDTGFTEWLTLPPDAIEQLGLRRVDHASLTFGNSGTEEVDIYEGRVYWCGFWRPIRVHELPGVPTIGMELLRGHRIEFDALGDGEIDVEVIV